MELRKKKKTTITTTYEHYIVSGIGSYLSSRVNGIRKKMRNCRRRLVDEMRKKRKKKFPLLLLFSNTHCHTFHRSRLQIHLAKMLSFFLPIVLSLTLLYSFFFCIIIHHGYITHELILPKCTIFFFFFRSILQFLQR